MKRWIVNPKERTVRDVVHGAPSADLLAPGEFFYDAPTAADAMQSGGGRRLLAENAMRDAEGAAMSVEFKYVGRKRVFTEHEDDLELLASHRSVMAIITRDPATGLYTLGSDGGAERLQAALAATRPPDAIEQRGSGTWTTGGKR